ncbi:MAG: hypothetical protein PHE55_04620 [Methylococcaceae bacterium]|nr:hypothetical protein [Methylococcaceae bacterium]
MNPLLYKAHPLLYLTVDLLSNPTAHTAKEFGYLALIYLTVNLVWTPCLVLAAKKSAGFAPSLAMAYLLALPSLLLYLPLILTILGDVIAHEFRFSERFIPVFCLLLATQMMAALFAVSLKHPLTRRPIGLQNGLTISLFLLLLSLPLGLMLLGLNSVYDMLGKPAF